MFVKVLIDIPVDREYTYRVPQKYENTAAVGVRAMINFNGRKVVGYITEVMDEFSADYEIKEIARTIDKSPVFGKNEVDLAYWMSRFYLCSPGEALSCMIPGGRVNREMVLPPVEEDITNREIRNLTEYQKNAIDVITTSSDRFYYLYGVTGSGKSEVFFQCAKRMIAEGKQVIYLVPEITLTFQLISLLKIRFGDRIAVLHSAMTDSQRIEQWRLIKNGKVDIAVGARSAVFAPFERLGMIIIDEEHENTYKSGNTPRYHSRQIAQYRCSMTGAKLVMGSATPSLEAWHMMQTGAVRKLELPERAGSGRFPSVRIVDMLGEKNLISRDLAEKIRETKQRGKQTILFLNRRGYSYFFHCNDCGYEMTCPHCSVALTYHRDRGKMVCHYCGYETDPIHVCPECHSLDVGYSGFGTEMVEEEIQRLFPNMKVERLDTDAAADKNRVFEVLDRFRKGESDILLGTQMVAKGLNFPNVELVGIVLADSSMNIPDFRNQEKTFSLLVQVAGRAGRFSDTGLVMIQTYKPRNEAIQYALRNDVEGFYERELELRKESGFPPYSRLLNLVIRGRSEEMVLKTGDEFAQVLFSYDELMDNAVEILGPVEAPIYRMNRNFRVHIMLQCEDIRKCIKLVKAAMGNYRLSRGIYIEIDVDPLFTS